MKKKVYTAPAVEAISLEHGCLLSGSKTGIGGNSGLEYGGGSSEPGRARLVDDWDEWDE